MVSITCVLTPSARGEAAHPHSDESYLGDSSSVIGTVYDAFSRLLGPGTLSCSHLGMGSARSLAERMCDDAFQAICGSASTDHPGSRDYSAIFQEARDSAGARFGFQPTMPALMGYLRSHPSQEDAVLQHLTDARLAAARRRLAPLGKGAVPAAADEVIRAMVAAIDSPGSGFAGSPLPADQRAAIVNALTRLRVPDPLEFLEGGPSDPAVRNLIRSRCDPDGLKINAFKPPGRDLVILCTGYLIFEGLGLPGSRERLLAELAQVIAHEAGHAIDADSFPRLNEANVSCLGTLLDLTEPRHVRDREKDVDEIAADHWAAQTLAELARRQPTAEAVARLIFASAESDCRFDLSHAARREPGHAHAHPPRRFRLNTILGGNPAIRRALGCADTGGWPEACASR